MYIISHSFQLKMKTRRLSTVLQKIKQDNYVYLTTKINTTHMQIDNFHRGNYSNIFLKDGRCLHLLIFVSNTFV